MNLNPNLEFKGWPKIPRLLNERVTITEKMDGTNACIVIQDGEIVGIQSRNRLIFPEGFNGMKDCDNAGFAGWVRDNEQEILLLGDGHHYGEWCGPGIQSNPHKLDVKRFFLFNTQRWTNNAPNRCSPVRVLYEGPFTSTCVDDALSSLLSYAKSENYTPEGIIIYNHLAKNSYKVTYKNPEGGHKNEQS